MTPTPELSLSAQIAQGAELIVNNLEQTDYQHDEFIDVDAHIYDCDCNGFVGFLLETIAPDHYAMIPKEAGEPRPRAFKYYEFFESLSSESTGWQAVHVLAEVRCGDIIAWRFPGIEEGHDTGHVLIAAEPPRSLASGTLAFRVYDSASEPHFEDTRASSGRFPNGVGSGFVNFHVNDTGEPVSFQFAPGEDFETHPIAIGRVLMP